MAIDLNRFIATFFDEAQEHLESIEEKAMALGSGRADAETLNSIFRAAHSIKGGSGTFGFTQLSEATHEMETLFDGLRKGKGEADEGTVRVLLDACDAFKAHLARLKAGERGADPAMETIRAELAAYRGDSGARPPAASGAPSEESFFDAPPAAPAKAEAYGLFEEPAAAVPAPAEKYGLFEAEA
ncbi:MAG TPA: Hpt domain-containing protein, partial [Usitatibacter sp.]